MAKVCGLEQIADNQKSDTLVIILRETLTCKLRAASVIFALKTCLYFSEARQSHVQLRTKAYYVDSLLLD